MRAVGPSGLISRVIPDVHVLNFAFCIRRFVEVELEEIHVSPTVVVTGFQDQVIDVPGVHGLVPRTVPLQFVGVQESVASGVLDEEISNHGCLRGHRNVGDLVVVKPGTTAVNGVPSEVVSLNPNRDLAFQTFVGVVVVVAGIIGRWSFAVAVKGDGDVLVGIGETVKVGVVVVLDPQVHVEAGGRTREVLTRHPNLLVGLRHHPGVVEERSPVGVHVGIGPRAEDLQVEEVGFVGVDGDVEGNTAGFVGVVICRRAQQVAAFVAANSETIRLAACGRAQVHVPVEVAANDAGAVGHLFPFNGDVAVRGIDVLEFEHQEVRTWVRGFVQVLQTDFADEVDVLAGFR